MAVFGMVERIGKARNLAAVNVSDVRGSVRCCG
jgi:hypothetical protein